MCTPATLLPADVSLFEVGSHADRLSIELVGLLQPRLVGTDQIGQVDVNVQVVGGHAGRVLLPGDNLTGGQRKPEIEVVGFMLFSPAGDRKLQRQCPSQMSENLRPVQRTVHLIQLLQEFAEVTPTRRGVTLPAA